MKLLKTFGSTAKPILIASLVLFSSVTLEHTEIAATVAADNAMLMTSTEKLQLSYSNQYV